MGYKKSTVEGHRMALQIAFIVLKMIFVLNDASRAWDKVPCGIKVLGKSCFSFISNKDL